MGNGESPYERALDDERRAAARSNPYDSARSGTWDKKKSNRMSILFIIIVIIAVGGIVAWGLSY